jgi:hypothetical protein
VRTGKDAHSWASASPKSTIEIFPDTNLVAAPVEERIAEDILKVGVEPSPAVQRLRVPQALQGGVHELVAPRRRGANLFDHVGPLSITSATVIDVVFGQLS